MLGGSHHHEPTSADEAGERDDRRDAAARDHREVGEADHQVGRGLVGDGEPHQRPSPSSRGGRPLAATPARLTSTLSTRGGSGANAFVADVRKQRERARDLRLVHAAVAGRDVRSRARQLDGPADLEVRGGEARGDADRALDRGDLRLLRRRQRAVGDRLADVARAARCRRRSRPGARARPRTRARAAGRCARDDFQWMSRRSSPARRSRRPKNSPRRPSRSAIASPRVARARRRARHRDARRIDERSRAARRRRATCETARTGTSSRADSRSACRGRAHERVAIRRALRLALGDLEEVAALVDRRLALQSSTSIEYDARFGLPFLITTSIKNGSPAKMRGGGRRSTESCAASAPTGCPTR